LLRAVSAFLSHEVAFLEDTMLFQSDQPPIKPMSGVSMVVPTAGAWNTAPLIRELNEVRAERDRLVHEVAGLRVAVADLERGSVCFQESSKPVPHGDLVIFLRRVLRDEGFSLTLKIDPPRAWHEKVD
jgi:hypothetical protein